MYIYIYGWPKLMGRLEVEPPPRLDEGPNPSLTIHMASPNLNLPIYIYVYIYLYICTYTDI